MSPMKMSEGLPGPSLGCIAPDHASGKLHCGCHSDAAVILPLNIRRLPLTTVTPSWTPAEPA